MRRKIIGFFIVKQLKEASTVLCSVVKHQEAVEHSRSGEKHWTASRVFPYTSFVLYHFLGALQQNKAQSRFLYSISIARLRLLYLLSKSNFLHTSNLAKF